MPLLREQGFTAFEARDCLGRCEFALHEWHSDNVSEEQLDKVKDNLAVWRGAPKYGRMRLMKTKLETPDALFGLAKSAAADGGGPNSVPDRPWLKPIGKLRGLRKETARISQIIEEEFGRLEQEDFR